MNETTGDEAGGVENETILVIENTLEERIQLLRRLIAVRRRAARRPATARRD